MLINFDLLSPIYSQYNLECVPHRPPFLTFTFSLRFKGDLKYHVKRKHPERMDLPSTISKPRSAKEGKAYPCPVASCSCGFKWARDLRRHIKTKHPENDEESESSSSLEKSPPSPSSSSSSHALSSGHKVKDLHLNATKGSKSSKSANDSNSMVTLSISSFYDDGISMLQLPSGRHLERN